MRPSLHEKQWRWDRWNQGRSPSAYENDSQVADLIHEVGVGKYVLLKDGSK